MTFRETAANTTPAVQFWYDPGEKIGKEFIYPKDQAMRIAQRTGVAVMTDGGRVTADAQMAASTTQAPSSVQAEAQAGTTGVVDGSGLPADDTRADAGVGTSGQASAQGSVRREGTVAQNTTPAQTDSYARDNSGVSNELPATASPLALSGLLGLLLLAGAMGLRAFRR